MELTQKIACTQELYANNFEKEVPDQIGFLGICGVKYPLKKGPNKIGRDPDTCNIVLNLNSISRQHAVINILNSYDYMLMDLDSANKTKVGDKTLQAYIPTPLKNGDMVQFGQVFGVFRLFEENNDLPMTQALDIPETPIRNQHVSKVNLVTTIPESPEVSDRDDSFIVASQPKSTNVFKSPNTNLIKSSGKTIALKPIGLNKVDNVYWNSFKKSDSFNLESDTSTNTDTSLQTSKAKENIHEQDTQVHNSTNNLIYEADTQIAGNASSIYNIDTQLPRADCLPEVHKVHGQVNVNIDLFTENKENDNNIYNSKTQDVSILKNNDGSKNLAPDVNKSDDDIILFDEIESAPLDENFESQALLLPEMEALDKIEPINEDHIEITDKQKQPQNISFTDRRDSGSSTDCEDINFTLTQNIPERRTNDDDNSTDCEDAPEQITKNKSSGNSNIDDNLTDCEDETDINNRGQNKKRDDINLEDLATQIIEEIPSHCNTIPTISKKLSCLEDLPTQVIDEDKNCLKENNNEKFDLEDLPTQILHQESQNIFSEQAVSFKVPVSPFKRKKKDQSEATLSKKAISDKNDTKGIDSEDDEKYYAATQELLNDLCTQRELSPEIVSFVVTKNISKKMTDSNETNNKATDLKTTEDIDEKIDQFVMNLTNSLIKDVDVEKEIIPLKKVSSDSSDVDSTPKKLQPMSFLETKLPNTQEIKQYLKLNGYASSESSKESETDCSSPHIHKKKNRKDVKRVDLTNKFELEKLPERVTRVRKPTSKMQYTENCKMNPGKIPKLRSFETRPSKDKETVPSSSAFNSNLKEKKKTNNTDSNKNDVSQEINKIKENNKIQENDWGKESIMIQDKSKRKDKIIEKKKNQEKSRSRDKQKDQEENNNENNRTVQKSTRKSSRTKDKQSETKKEDNQLKVITDKIRPLKTESTNSIRKKNGSHSKTNCKESNTIDKYLSPAPVELKETDQTKISNKRSSRSKNKEPINDEVAIETEVRRSKRQRTTKKSFELIEPKLKETKPTNPEQSAVYNISSESGTDSPNKLKRQASNFILPLAKKSKTVNSSKVVLRSTPARKTKTHYVLFTAFPCEEVKVKLEKLGAVVVSDIMQCTVVLTLQIKRTFKLLCAVGLGKPIVGPNWVQACVDTNIIVDPWLYLIKDELTEKRFQFNLERILLGNRQFLKGYNVSSTPNIMPSPPEMKLIVECSGGSWTVGGKNWICVSSSSDKSLWNSLKRKGATIVSTEFILGGVLRQTIDIKRNILA